MPIYWNKFSKVVAKKANELKIFPEVLASKKDLLCDGARKKQRKTINWLAKKNHRI